MREFIARGGGFPDLEKHGGAAFASGSRNSDVFLGGKKENQWENHGQMEGFNFWLTSTKSSV